MNKNKKILSMLSTTAIAGLMIAAVNSTAFAKATSIAVTSNDGKIYEYQYDPLKASAVSQILKGSSDLNAKLYNDFLQRKTAIRAYYDDTKKSYVEFDTISKEAVAAVTNGTSFTLDSFIEAASTPTVPLTTIPVSTDANGNVVVNGQVINSGDTQAPTGTGIYAKLRTSPTGNDKVIVYFSETMDAATLINKDNYKFINGEGDSKALPENTTISVGGDNKSVILEFPTTYFVKTTGKVSNGSGYAVTALVVSNVKDEAGNFLGNVAYSNNDKIDASQTGTNVMDNSIKVYYDGDDLKADVTFTRALDTVNKDDFTFGGVHPNKTTANGSKLTLVFSDGAIATPAEIAAHPIIYANGKANSNPTKIDVIKSQGQNAKMAISATTTTDETGARVSINDAGGPATLSNSQAAAYDYNANPKTAPDYWSAVKDANGAKVYITFDTILDGNSGIKTDDFIFTCNGTVISADCVHVSGNTVEFKFDTTNKYYETFKNSIDVRATSQASLRTLKDMDGNNANYQPSNDDLKRRTVTIYN